MGKAKLDKREARTDLTSRECAKLIGGMLSGLAGMARAGEIKLALSWWAQHPEVVDAMFAHAGQLEAVGEDIAATAEAAQGKLKN